MILESVVLEDFILRTLSPDEDLTTYLKWMRDPESFPFIRSAKTTYSHSELVAYINNVNESMNSVQFSAFTRHLSKHIGNIKFHDIDFEAKTSFVGFFIAEKEYQNRGLAQQFFKACSSVLFQKFEIRQFLLSVEAKHSQAIKAYHKIGFTPLEGSHASSHGDTLILGFTL